MKKIIFRTAIIAVLAMVLATGSAMAAKISGNLGFTGQAIGYVADGYSNNDPNGVYGYMMIEMYPEQYPGAWAIMSNRITEGDFTRYYAAGKTFPGRTDEDGNVYLGWGLPPGFVTGFPTDLGIQFRDEESLTRLSNINIVHDPGEFITEAFLGFLTSDEVDGNIGFSFYTTKLVDLETTGNGATAAVTMKLLGYVDHPDWDRTAVEYEVAFTYASFDAGVTTWNYEINITAMGGAPDVPEPGTLVLFGTGLLGAAIVARRKMKK